MSLLRMAGRRALSDGNLARAEALIAEHRTAAEEAGDTGELLQAINSSARLAAARGDWDAARRLFLELREAASGPEYPWMHANAVVNLGALELDAGDYHAGLEYSTAAADLLRELEDESGLVVALHNCGWATLCLGDSERAEAHLREALVVAGHVEAQHRIAQLALALGAALVAQGDAERGTHLLGAGAALCEALDVRVFDDELGQRIHEHAVADAKAALGEEAFAAAWEDSREMTPDEIVGFASSHP